MYIYKLMQKLKDIKIAVGFNFLGIIWRLSNMESIVFTKGINEYLPVINNSQDFGLLL